MQNTKLPEVAGEHALDKAARLVGGRPTLASHLGVTVSAIGNWKTRGVPLENCMPIERATGGLVTRRDLRPGDWLEHWPELATASLAEALPGDLVKAAGPLPPLAVADTPEWDGVDRRDFLNPASVPAELDRRHHGADTAGQGV